MSRRIGPIGRILASATTAVAAGCGDDATPMHGGAIDRTAKRVEVAAGRNANVYLTDNGPERFIKASDDSKMAR